MRISPPEEDDMTAIGISTPVTSPATATRAVAAHATRLRLTVRGRRALALLAALPAIVALAAAIIGGGTALATRDGGAPAGTFETVTVTPGDSLWSIAEEMAPTRDPRDVVDEIVRLNALDSVELTAGQSLSIPVELVGGP
jgi:hypothetical protein